MRGRRFLDDFLVASLHGAIPLTQRDHLAFAIAKNLHFNMTCLVDIFFQEKPCILEIVLCQILDRFVSSGQFILIPAQAHADAAAASGAFKHDGITDMLGLMTRRFKIFQQISAWQERHLIFRGQSARCMFQAKGAHLLRGGADKANAVRDALFSKIGFLTEEAITGVYGLRARLLGDF